MKYEATHRTLFISLLGVEIRAGRAGRVFLFTGLMSTVILLFLGARVTGDERVTAREFVLVDAKGEMLARLGHDKWYNSAVLSFFVPGNGRPRLQAGLQVMGDPFVRLLDTGSTGPSGSELSLTNEGDPGVPILRFRAPGLEKERATLEMFVDRGGRQQVVAKKPSGEIAWSLPPSEAK